MGQLYFAYGSNLNIAQMAHRCPDARKVGPLTLPGFELVFRGCADIQFRKGAKCPGGVWELTPKCEAALDRYEGVKGGLYFKHYVPVSVEREGQRVTEDMLVYVMTRQDDVWAPSMHYFNGIKDGYRDFGIEAQLPVLIAARDDCPDWKGEWPVYYHKAAPAQNPALKTHHYKGGPPTGQGYYWDAKARSWRVRQPKRAKGAHKARKSDQPGAPWDDALDWFDTQGWEG